MLTLDFRIIRGNLQGWLARLQRTTSHSHLINNSLEKQTCTGFKEYTFKENKEGGGVNKPRFSNERKNQKKRN